MKNSTNTNRRSAYQENSSNTGVFRYTEKEMTIKNKTVFDAVEAAKIVLKEKRPGTQVCIDCLKNKNMNEKISIKQLNEYVEQIINDSYAYSRLS
jgi:hypothetical protein